METATVKSSVKTQNSLQDSNWNRENARGRREADELISTIRHGENPTLLGKFAKLLIERGDYGGYEVGFFHRIACYLAS